MSHGEDEENENTTIWVRKKTVARLERYKVHHRETNDDILNRLMDKVKPPEKEATT